jgi:hypothetical protein
MLNIVWKGHLYGLLGIYYYYKNIEEAYNFRIKWETSK